MTDPLRAAITAAIERQGLTVTEAARRADVPRTTLSAYLAGRRELSTANVARLLAALGIALVAGKPPKGYDCPTCVPSTPSPARAGLVRFCGEPFGGSERLNP